VSASRCLPDAARGYGFLLPRRRRDLRRCGTIGSSRARWTSLLRLGGAGAVLGRMRTRRRVLSSATPRSGPGAAGELIAAEAGAGPSFPAAENYDLLIAAAPALRQRVEASFGFVARERRRRLVSCVHTSSRAPCATPLGMRPPRDRLPARSTVSIRGRLAASGEIGAGLRPASRDLRPEGAQAGSRRPADTQRRSSDIRDRVTPQGVEPVDDQRPSRPRMTLLGQVAWQQAGPADLRGRIARARASDSSTVAAVRGSCSEPSRWRCIRHGRHEREQGELESPQPSIAPRSYRPIDHELHIDVPGAFPHLACAVDLPRSQDRGADAPAAREASANSGLVLDPPSGSTPTAP